jgi:glycosyltransferase involved in cell wall biosynthesis
MRRIAHYISLDTIGGVETLFESVIANSSLNSLEHNLVLYTGKIHPHLRQTIAGRISSVFRLKHYNFLKLPRFPKALRVWNNQRISDLLDAQTIIFWNSLNQHNWSGRDTRQSKMNFIFYDQGTSWYRERNSGSQLFLSKMTKTLCCSYASKRVLELFHQHSGEKEVILNPIRPNFFDSVAVEKSLPSNRPLRIGVAARFVPVKGISLAIHALSILKSRKIDAQLHIAGTGKLRPGFEKLAKCLDVDDRVHFLGLLKNMPLFFEGIDLFLCPSIREPFGIVAAEALGKGCPVICSRVDGLAEAVCHGKTGITIAPSLPLKEYERLGGGLNGLPRFIYYPDDDTLGTPRVLDPADIADSIEQVVDDAELYSSMSRAGIEDAVKRFSFSNYLNRFQQVLDHA